MTLMQNTIKISLIKDTYYLDVVFLLLLFLLLDTDFKYLDYEKSNRTFEKYTQLVL